MHAGGHGVMDPQRRLEVRLQQNQNTKGLRVLLAVDGTSSLSQNQNAEHNWVRLRVQREHTSSSLMILGPDQE